MEQYKLLEYMEEIKAIAAAQQNRITKEEIRQYLKDMELGEQQMEAVYHYLASGHIAIEGYQYIPEQEEAADLSVQPGGEAAQKKVQKEKSSAAEKTRREEDEPKKTPDRAEQNLRRYRRELSELEINSQEEIQEMFRRYLSGENHLRNALAEGHLAYVSSLAGKYCRRGVAVEEIIAEGNLGLMNALLVLEEGAEQFLNEDGLADMEKIQNVIQMEVRQAMENMIDEAVSGKDWENTVLAKMNLLHEAAKHLAEEYGRTATMAELVEYTKMPAAEIRDMIELSGPDKDKLI